MVAVPTLVLQHVAYDLLGKPILTLIDEVLLVGEIAQSALVSLHLLPSANVGRHALIAVLWSSYFILELPLWTVLLEPLRRSRPAVGTSLALLGMLGPPRARAT